jgi:glycosyltransferase involved in cell wall biosynthesis
LACGTEGELAETDRSEEANGKMTCADNEVSGAHFRKARNDSGSSIPEGRSPLVSVVTPFFNTAAYLEECIQSVIGQTYENWEYILLNNCSTDGSAEIAERYALQYPAKIRVVRNATCLPQVQNYNTALRLISPQSDYCKMVQADDWLFPECLRRMVEVAEAQEAVGVVAAYELEGDEVRLDGLPYPSGEVSGRDAARLYFLRNKYLFGTPTSILMRSNIVRSRDPFYDESYAPFEDGHACFELMEEWNFGFVHEVLTFSRRENASILSAVRDFGLEQFLRFSLLVAHGRRFLNANEYLRCLRQAEREYFLFLAAHVFAWPSKHRDFWKFHRKGLASVQCRLGPRLLAPWIPRAFLDKLWFGIWRRWDLVADAIRDRIALRNR